MQMFGLFHGSQCSSWSPRQHTYHEVVHRSQGVGKTLSAIYACMDILFACHVKHPRWFSHFIIFWTSLHLIWGQSHLFGRHTIDWGFYDPFFDLEGHLHAPWSCLFLRYGHGHALETYFEGSWSCFGGASHFGGFYFMILRMFFVFETHMFTLEETWRACLTCFEEIMEHLNTLGAFRGQCCILEPLHSLFRDDIPLFWDNFTLIIIHVAWPLYFSVVLQ